jgi:hypothetical protein
MLNLANLGDAEATVVLSAVTGTAADRTIVVPPGGSAAIALGPQIVWRMDAAGATGLHASLVYSSSNWIAGAAVWPTDAAATPIRVYP